MQCGMWYGPLGGSEVKLKRWRHDTGINCAKSASLNNSLEYGEAIDRPLELFPRRKTMKLLAKKPCLGQGFDHLLHFQDVDRSLQIVGQDRQARLHPDIR